MDEIDLTLTAAINQLVEKYGFRTMVAALVEHCQRHAEEEKLEGGDFIHYWQVAAHSLRQVVEDLEKS